MGCPLDQTDSWSTPWGFSDKPSEIEMKDVALAVEATALTQSSKSYVFGHNLVAIVQNTNTWTETLGFDEGRRVMALVDWAVDSRSIHIPVENLLHVPRHLDAAEVASVAAVYLESFQALFHGVSRSNRYAPSSLSGKRILVAGGKTENCLAIARISKLFGARRVYIRSDSKEFPKRRYYTLTNDGFISSLVGTIDLVVDFDCFQCAYWKTKLARKGRVVCVQQKEQNLLASLWQQCTLSTLKRSSLYLFEESFASNPQQVREDFGFLLMLLEKRAIRPDIDCYVHLEDVAAAPYKHSSAGVVICEPWR